MAGLRLPDAARSAAANDSDANDPELGSVELSLPSSAARETETGQIEVDRGCGRHLFMRSLIMRLIFLLESNSRATFFAKLTVACVCLKRNENDSYLAAQHVVFDCI